MLARHWMRSLRMSRGMECPSCRRIPATRQSSVTTRLLRQTYLGNRVLNNLLVCHIALVAYEKLVHTFCGVAVNLLQPLLHVVERVHVGHIVDDADAMSTTIVG